METEGIYTTLVLARCLEDLCCTHDAIRQINYAQMLLTSPDDKSCDDRMYN